MAVKMTAANAAFSLRNPVLAEKYNSASDGLATCTSPGCQVRLVHIPNYTYQRAGKNVYVPDYFRLAPNQHHRESCNFNVDVLIDKIVARSKRVKTDLDATETILDAGRGKIVYYRLHILVETLRSVQCAESDEESGEEIWKRRTGTRYRQSPREIEPYLATAADVLHLIAQIQSRDELGKRLILKYESKKIPWDQFFFDFKDEDYCYLYELLEQGMSHKSVVAVVVEPKRLNILNSGNEFRVWCSDIECLDENNESAPITPVLYCTDFQLARAMAHETYLLVCGIPRLSQYTKPNAHVNFKILRQGQFCRYSPT